MTSDRQIKAGIHRRMLVEGFKYFLVDGDLFGWFSDFLAVNERGEIWEMVIIRSDQDLKKLFSSKQNRLKKCRNLSPARIPTYSSIVCPFNVIAPIDVPDYSGLFYVIGSNKMTPIENMKKIKHPERLSNELMNEVEWNWIFQQSQNQYAKQLWG